MIETPFEIVHHCLHVEFTKAGKDLTPDVRFMIAVGIFEVPDIRSRGDIHAPFPECQTGRPGEFFGKHGGSVEPAIAVDILQYTNFTDGSRLLLSPGFILRFIRVRIVIHFDDIRQTIFVILHRDRISH